MLRCNIVHPEKAEIKCSFVIMTIVRLQCDYLFGKHFVSGLPKDQTLPSFGFGPMGGKSRKYALKTIVTLDRIYSCMVSLPVHLLPLPDSNSQQNGQEKSHSCWSNSSTLCLCSARAWEIFWEPCQPAARGVKAPSSPLSCAREIVLLALASDILCYKSEEIWTLLLRQSGCLHLV